MTYSPDSGQGGPGPLAQDAEGVDQPPVVCVVLNWNGWRDTVRCLGALRRTEYRAVRVVVVDNCSTDDSVERIREQFPEIPLLRAAENRGFGAGNNLGIAWGMRAGARYLWLLNNDTEASPGALGSMVGMAEADRGLGAVGSELRYMAQPAVVQAWGGGRVNLWSGYSVHARGPRPDAWFDYLTAASVLVRAEAFADAGLFDESFFLYWEDTDLGFRIRGKGWRLGVSAGATVLHAEGASTGRNYVLLDRFSVCSGLQFLRKHAPVPAISCTVFATVRLLRRALRGEWSRVRAVWRGIGDFRTGARASGSGRS